MVTDVCHTIRHTSLENTAEIERLVVLENPAASNAVQANSQISELAAAGWWVEPVQTEPKITDTASKLFDVVKPGDALVSKGGDGTANTVINVMRDLDLFGHMVLFVGAGNANDIPWIVHGKAPLHETLRPGRGQVMSAYALEAIIETGDTTTSRLSLGYNGIGAAARASDKLNDVKKWPAHTIMEPLAVWHTIGTAPYFRVQPDYAGSPPQFATDISTMKGDRIAKYGHPHADVRVPQYERVITKRRGMVRALAEMVKMQRGTIEGDMMQQPFSFFAKSADGTDLPMYHDGEVSLVPSGSRITMQVYERPYTTLSTRWLPDAQPTK